MFRRMAAFAAACLLAVALSSTLALAQVPSISGPYNIDLTTPVITNTNQTAGTKTAIENNLAYQGVVCVFNETAHSGSPSTTISIDAFDAATATWNTLVTSGIATTASAGTQTPTVVVTVRPGIQTSSLPSGWSAASLVLPRTWRVTQVVTGSGFSPATTSKVGCNYAR